MNSDDFQLLSERIGPGEAFRFKNLYFDWLTIKNLFIQLEGLYGTEGSRRLLAETAFGFFLPVQRVMFDAIILGLTKIVEDSKSQVVSFQKFKSCIQGQGKVRSEDDFWKMCFQKIDSLKVDCEKYVGLRNAQIAHSDLRARSGDLSLPTISLDEIRASIDMVYDLISDLYAHLLEAELMNELIQAEGGAQSLLFALAVAKEVTVQKDTVGYSGLSDEMKGILSAARKRHAEARKRS